MRGSLWREKFIIRKCVILIDCRVGYDSQHLSRKNILNSIYLKENLQHVKCIKVEVLFNVIYLNLFYTQLKAGIYLQIQKHNLYKFRMHIEDYPHFLSTEMQIVFPRLVAHLQYNKKASFWIIYCRLLSIVEYVKN